MFKEIILQRNGQVTPGKLEKIGFGIENEDNYNTILFRFADEGVSGVGSLITDIKDSQGKNVVLPLQSEDLGYTLVVKKEYLTNEDITFQVQITGRDFNWISQQRTLPIFESLEAGDGEVPDTVQSWIVSANSVIAEFDENIDDKLFEVDEKIDEVDDKLEEVNSMESTIEEREAERESNEALRQQNEADREANEVSREQYITDLKARVDRGEFKGDKGDQGEQGIQGEKGDAGSIKFIIVSELPTTDIDHSAIYLVPSQEQEEHNVYDEFIYTDNGWEQLGSTPIEVDLTDYVKNTDYATGTKGGVIKLSGNYGTEVNTSGEMIGKVHSYDIYASKPSQTLISKGTLENVLTGKGLVNKDDVRY